MERAIELSEKGRLSTPPNPWVGCVIVKNGEIVGEGFHTAYGKAHAEISALSLAKEKAEGATAFITLEPCCHQGKTPPCVNALIKAKIAKVVVALEDPDPKVKGNGFQRLREAGIQVSVGLCKSRVAHSLLPYLHHRKTKTPYCILKAAISIDGRVAAANGSSQWITNNLARSDAHCLRAKSQAIIIGSGTALMDQPTLTARYLPLSPSQQPLRVLLDSTGKTLGSLPLFDTALAPTLVITSENSSIKYRNKLREKGIEVEIAPLSNDGRGLHLPFILKLLGQRGVLQALIEGGPKLYASFLQMNLIDHLRIYMGACTLGSEGIPLFPGNSPESIENAKRWKLLEVKHLDESIRIDYIPIGEKSCSQVS